MIQLRACKDIYGVVFDVISSRHQYQAVGKNQPSDSRTLLPSISSLGTVEVLQPDPRSASLPTYVMELARQVVEAPRRGPKTIRARDRRQVPDDSGVTSQNFRSWALESGIIHPIASTCVGLMNLSAQRLIVRTVQKRRASSHFNTASGT
jgi:hypothetical protein